MMPADTGDSDSARTSFPLYGSGSIMCVPMSPSGGRAGSRMAKMDCITAESDRRRIVGAAHRDGRVVRRMLFQTRFADVQGRKAGGMSSGDDVVILIAGKRCQVASHQRLTSAGTVNGNRRGADWHATSHVYQHASDTGACHVFLELTRHADISARTLPRTWHGGASCQCPPR